MKHSEWLFQLLQSWQLLPIFSRCYFGVCCFSKFRIQKTSGGVEQKFHFKASFTKIHFPSASKRVTQRNLTFKTPKSIVVGRMRMFWRERGGFEGNVFLFIWKENTRRKSWGFFFFAGKKGFAWLSKKVSLRLQDQKGPRFLIQAGLFFHVFGVWLVWGHRVVKLGLGGRIAL